MTSTLLRIYGGVFDERMDAALEEWMNILQNATENSIPSNQSFLRTDGVNLN